MMKFDKHYPPKLLRPYVKYFVVSENALENEYKVFPSTGLVIGLQYRGQLSILNNATANKLSSAGITGISDGYKVFKNSAHIGTVLIYFTETGFTHFSSYPANELFNLSLSLEDIFGGKSISELEERLATANTDKQRINMVEEFLISQMRDVIDDKLIGEAVRLIYQSNGTIRIQELNKKLFISQSPFEKRFRKVVGSSAKKFASIVRFNHIMNNYNEAKPLTEICYESKFFDQAHFIKNFKQFTGDTPQNFKSHF
jgi:AraC-like DNA-binding protein